MKRLRSVFRIWNPVCKVIEWKASDLRASPLCAPELLEAGLRWAVACPWCKPPLRESGAAARHAASCSDQVLQSGLRI